MCVHAYRQSGFKNIKLTDDSTNCESAVADTIQKNFFINSSYDIILKVQVKLGDDYFDLDSFTHYSSTHISEIIKDNDLNYALLP